MKRFRPLLLFCTGLIVGTILMEGILRMNEVWPLWKVATVAQASFYGPDWDTGYSHRPDRDGLWLTENRAWRHVNKTGQLGPDYSIPPMPGTLRVAVVGDSIVESLQVADEDTFIRKSEHLLRHDKIHAEVLNFGLSGASAAVSAARIDHAVFSASPDLIVLLLKSPELLLARVGDDSAFPAYISGSSNEIVRGTEFRQGRGFQLRSGILGSVLYWLLDHSRLANILNNRKNVGFFNEVSNPQNNEVSTAAAAPQTCAFNHKTMSPVQQAILDDLSYYPDGSQPRLILALTGLSTQCDSLTERQTIIEEVYKALSKRLPDVSVLDLDAVLSTHMAGPEPDLSVLHGFGRNLGTGHLNKRGHNLYAAVLTDAIQRFIEQHP
ncbi:MAG: hypothetical protein P1V34_05140 [Alphaproteobacteria bacterium]|nr:hypothetical protein [Alphaproteobacteria bacterium]